MDFSNKSSLIMDSFDMESVPIASTSQNHTNPLHPTYYAYLDPHNLLTKPAFIGTERLSVSYASQPPSDLRGYYSDGIEYYCCCNHNCQSVWATQWTPTPRRNLVQGKLDLDSYKTVAVSKICRDCKAVIREADARRKRTYEEHKVKMDEAAFLHPSVAQCTGDSLLIDAHAGSNVTAAPGADGVATKPNELENVAAGYVPKYRAAQIMRQPVTKANETERVAALYSTQHVTLQEMRKAVSIPKRKPTAPAAATFEDVNLTPPPAVKEDPASLATRDPSWDVVDDDDANEEWAIINHFGSVALCHRDAHADTPTARP